KAFSGAAVATYISKEWLGAVGGILAILGIVAAPITSGDTALRSARLIAADFLHIDQRSISKRLLICIPLFLVTIGVLVYSLSDAEGFKVIWRYFAWCNQTLSVFTFWAITVYLVQQKQNFYITLLPALLMTLVCSTYICIAPEGLSFPQGVAYALGLLTTLSFLTVFLVWYRKQ
ncbi:MAG: carbon starvation protein A, partial [Bacteroidaceae bacterium]|nr:carbon starvation protein A [Bacteroidaceae bacterium]